MGSSSLLVKMFSILFLVQSSELYPSDFHFPGSYSTYNEDLPEECELLLPDPHQKQPTNAPGYVPFDFSTLSTVRR